MKGENKGAKTPQKKERQEKGKKGGNGEKSNYGYSAPVSVTD